METGRSLTTKVKNYLEFNFNAVVVNVNTAGTTGVADILACIKGEFYAFELKGKGDSIKPKQEMFLFKVGESGGYSGVVRSLRDLEDIIVNKLKYKPEKIKQIDL